jgi:hypothetical protein
MFGFPLLLIPLAIVNIIAFLMPGVTLDASLAAMSLSSGQLLKITLGDAIVLLGIALLLAEIAKAARPGTRGLMDHLLALIVFGVAAAELMLLPAFASSAFLLLTALLAAEFLVGIVLAVRRRSGAGFSPVPVPAHPSAHDMAAAPEAGAPSPDPARPLS